ncbi:MAG TPA: glycosyltransferase family 9 protein [Ktedonobacteraceae bacterium]|nr:glycosyltransferase family 9 protein [Ktedonobacteraceae bacterium]
MNIVIIRPGAIGDTLLTFPVLRALRAKYPDAHVTFVSNATVLPLAQEAGLADEVFDFQLVQWSELFSTAGIRTPSLRALLHESDLAIGWMGDPDHLVARNLREAGVGQVMIAQGRPPQGERVHVTEYLARTIGIEALPGVLDLRGDEKPHRNAGATSIALHPGSGGKQKCWPVERFAEVIERVWQQRWPVLLLFGPADGKQLAYLRQRLVPPAPELLTMLVDAPLIEVARQLRDCQCYLGNDSGITHLAAMLGLPTIALFGPSDPAVWHPVGPDSGLVRVVHEPELAKLPVETVLELIMKFHNQDR